MNSITHFAPSGESPIFTFLRLLACASPSGVDALALSSRPITN